MKKITLLLALLSMTSYAQDPAIEWQKTIGGSASDILNSVEATPDGGYIMAGYSASNISGDKTENSNGQLDIWIVKTNATGTVEWQNTIGGGGDDFVNAVKPTSDGGYIVFAGSDSNISGDKTENSRGGLDYWILKLNSTGGIEWQKTYGGTNPDFDTFGQQTADGGYIVGGYSDSAATGDKTEASNGQRDYWILKLNSSGGITWQNAIGGSLVDRVQAIAQTPEGGYIVGGFSTSGSTGDKIEGNLGGTDYWIVKLSPTGTIEWQNSIGGTGADAFRDLILTSDGGYLLAGYSSSNISSDKSENSNGDFDYWIIKLNSSGGITWQNTIGGAGTDYVRDIKQLGDGSYAIAGYSNSNISGDKTENSNGGYDYWLVKLDTSGNIVSQNSIGGAADESGPYLIPTSDGGFLMACSSDSNDSGDKADNNKGVEDYWLFKVDANILLGTESHVLSGLSAYPNPFSDRLTVNLGSDYANITVAVTNMLGQKVYAKHFENASIFDLSFEAPSGIYLITVATPTAQSTMKILKN